MKKLRARFKLWLSSKEAEGVFGDGKWRLLKAIETEGSLKSASESLQISYRKAWGDLKKAERYLNIALVEKQRGGEGGGGSDLTEQGSSPNMYPGGTENEISERVPRPSDEAPRPLCLYA